MNRLRWMQHQYPLDHTDAVLQKTPATFDVSVWEFFWPLMTGARLVMALPGGHQDPDYLAATIAREQATEALDWSWTEGETRAERFDAFRGLSDEERAAWLGHAVAKTLEASLTLPGERACAFHDHLGRLLGIEGLARQIGSEANWSSGARGTTLRMEFGHR